MPFNMAEVNNEKPLDEVNSTDNSVEGVLARPSGWMYKQVRVGKWFFPWYASPVAQLVIVAFVCFLCPGMFNALSGMGGGGQVNAKAADDSNVALYSTFAVVGKSLQLSTLLIAPLMLTVSQAFSQAPLSMLWASGRPCPSVVSATASMLPLSCPTTTTRTVASTSSLVLFSAPVLDVSGLHKV